jgi:putative endonuclease
MLPGIRSQPIGPVILAQPESPQLPSPRIAGTFIFMLEGGFVYIMSSITRRLYTGVTSELFIRVKKHKAKVYPKSFAARYNINRLVYFKEFGDIRDAINREAAIKNMHRVQKIQLIIAKNPTWRDLSEDWGKPAPVFHESKMRKPETF